MRSLALISILALTLAACGSGSSGDGAPATGTLQLLVTDGPFPGDLVKSATVCIVRVEARNADLEGWQVLFPVPEEEDPGTEPTEPPADPAEPEPPVDPVADPCVEIDLLPLTGGISALLAEIQVPVGTYDEVRLIVEAGEVVLWEDAHVESGDAYPESHTFNTVNGTLRFPSASQSGIKVKIENDIVVVPDSSGVSTALTLEFDLAKNFVFNGQPDAAPGVKRINFTPVVRATNTTTNGTITLAVEADPSTPNVPADVVIQPFPTVDVYSVAADLSETYVTTATGAEDGTLVISLLPGTYNLDVIAKGYETLDVDDIPVVVGSATDAGTVTLARASFWLGGHVLSDMGTAVDTDDMPIVGAEVTVWVLGAIPGTDTALATLTTDPSGGWYVTGVATGLTPGTYTVRITAGDHADAPPVDVTVVEWTPATVDATLIKDTL